MFTLGQCFKARLRQLRTSHGAANTHTNTYRSAAPSDCQVWIMGIAAGVAPLTALSVTLQWICLLIFSGMPLPPLDQSEILQRIFNKLTLQCVWRNLLDRERIVEVKGPGEVGQQAWKLLCYCCTSGPVLGQSLCVWVSPEKDKHRPECAFARSRAQSPQKDLIEMYPTAWVEQRR